MNTFYFVMKRIMRFALKVYYKKIKIEGLANIPSDKPLLIVSNHQNALMDALIVGALNPRNIHFLARQDVFNARTQFILKALKMMPVYRIRDGYASLKKNDAIFEACRALFAQKKSILMFPEGNHGEHHYLRPLTKGAARIALQAQAQSAEDLMILPVGINYFDHFAARTTVLMAFGKPIEVKDYQQLFAENEPKCLAALKEEMALRMKKLLAIPDVSSDYEQRKISVFHPKNSRLSLAQLRDLPTEATPISPPKKKRIIAQVLNPLPFFLMKRKLSGLKDVVFTSTVKFAIGFVSFPLWWILVYTLASLVLTPQIAGLLVFSMVLGLFYSYTSW